MCLRVCFCVIYVLCEMSKCLFISQVVYSENVADHGGSRSRFLRPWLRSQPESLPRGPQRARGNWTSPECQGHDNRFFVRDESPYEPKHYRRIERANNQSGEARREPQTPRGINLSQPARRDRMSADYYGRRIPDNGFKTYQ